MYKNIGKKIKAVAKVFAWIGIILFVLIGLIMAGVAGVMEGEPGLIVAGIIVAVVGALVSWISSFMVYGFGQLIDNSDMIKDMMIHNYQA